MMVGNWFKKGQAGSGTRTLQESGGPLPADLSVDLPPAVLIVTQRIEDLGQIEVWQVVDNFLWRQAEFPKLSNRPNGRPSPPDHRRTAQNIHLRFHIRMACDSFHVENVLHFARPVKNVFPVFHPKRLQVFTFTDARGGPPQNILLDNVKVSG